MIRLPEEIENTGKEYLSRVDQVMPRRIIGLMVTGSAVLGDYRRGKSDFDFLALIQSPLDRGELDILDRLHRKFRRDIPVPVLDGAYVTVDQLALDPRGMGIPRVREGILLPSDNYAANPVTWITCSRYPATLRGECPAIWNDESVLRAWCRENAGSYWRNWIIKARSAPASILYSLSRDAVSWGLLGITRIHATIKTGQIISKGASVSYAHEVFGRNWDDIVDEARRYRDGESSSLLRAPFLRRSRLLDYMNFVLKDID